jgi:uncharacterized protein YegJ (DUF2314 family)
VAKTEFPNAINAGKLSFQPAKWEEGDPRNRLIELTFDGFRGVSFLERQNAAIAQFFGGEDHVTPAKHDAELLAARDRARAQLPALAEKFRKGLPVGDHMLVKAPFRTTKGGDEWMWVEVLSWQGNDIGGILENKPDDVPELKAGAKVHVQQSELFDYLYVHADRKTEGNETGAILERREQSGRQ